MLILIDILWLLPILDHDRSPIWSLLYVLEFFWSLFVFRYVLGNFGDSRAILGEKLHICVRSLAMDG